MPTRPNQAHAVSRPVVAAHVVMEGSKKLSSGDIALRRLSSVAVVKRKTQSPAIALIADPPANERQALQQMSKILLLASRQVGQPARMPPETHCLILSNPARVWLILTYSCPYFHGWP